jgi:hypothetical protein
MKPKRFILVALAVVIVGFGIWWFTMPSAAVPVNTAAAPMPAKAEGPKPIAPPTVAAPIAAPAPNPVASQPLPASAPDPSGDPQTDLKIAVLDIARLIRDGGDPGAILETYTPPDKLTPQRIQEIQMGIQHRADMGTQDPGFKQFTQELTEIYAKAYESLENQTPTYNDAGDEATYMLTFVYPDGYSNQSSKTFVKINGKWYLKSD